MSAERPLRRTKEEILHSLSKMRNKLEVASASLSDSASVFDYRHLVTLSPEGHEIWTAAFQTAVNEHSVVTIPFYEKGYFIDKTIVIPSNRSIVAQENAHIKKVPQMDTLLLRNEHVRDGSFLPIKGDDRDENISVFGGIWEDTAPDCPLYHGMYDSENSMNGIDACMFFNNLTGLFVSVVTIVRAGGFGIQIGNITDGVIENVVFEKTIADGVHINGNTKNIIVKNISGSVADDIVALNMYDWQRSSVCFGPIENILCEDISLSPDSSYKAIRILPGKYYYSDGTISDCFIKDAILRRVSGIETFKFYFQSPAYAVGTSREKGDDGWGDNIFIEDIKIGLVTPIDKFEEYVSGDPILGSFAVFEFGSALGKVELKNISVTLDKEKYPTSYLACVGPKSIRRDGLEFFDPQINSSIELLVLDNVSVNGKRITPFDAKNFVHEIAFECLYGESENTAKGVVENISVV